MEHRDTQASDRLLKGHTYEVFCVAFSPDGRMLATGGYDENVILSDVATRTRKDTLRSDQGTIISVAFSPDDKTLAIVGTNNLQLWNAQTQKQIRKVSSRKEYQFTIAYSARNTLGIASSDSIKVQTMTRNDKPSKTTTISRPASLIRALAFSPSGEIMAGGADNGKVTLWSTGTGKRLAILNHDKSVYALAFSPSGATLATASGKNITVWDPATRQKKATLEGHTDLVSALAFTPNGSRLASAAYDRTIRLWTTA